MLTHHGSWISSHENVNFSSLVHTLLSHVQGPCVELCCAEASTSVRIQIAHVHYRMESRFRLSFWRSSSRKWGTLKCISSAGGVKAIYPNQCFTLRSLKNNLNTDNNNSTVNSNCAKKYVCGVQSTPHIPQKHTSSASHHEWMKMWWKVNNRSVIAKLKTAFNESADSRNYEFALIAVGSTTVAVSLVRRFLWRKGNCSVFDSEGHQSPEFWGLLLISFG